MAKHKWLLTLLTAFILLLALSYYQVQAINTSLTRILSDAQTLQVFDRNNQALNISYHNHWNTFDNLALYQIPDFLKVAFIHSEDRHFYQHSGIDWSARVNAFYQNIRSRHTVRGASTISEQVVRMIHPRPRTLWSKWLETFEVIQLERTFSKADILEFYLNQLPYAANRRGVLQAAHYYFNRDLATVTLKEMLALVVLARAPTSYDLYHNTNKIEQAIERLADSLYHSHQLSFADLITLQHQQFQLQAPQLAVNAAHFVNYVRQHQALTVNHHNSLHTTLDAALQASVQAILDQRLNNLAARGVTNAAAMVVDHKTGDILAWVVAKSVSGSQIDAVTVARQPGSALKPFLYALALDSGWTAATLINDAPLSQAIGNGLHRFKNYSNIYYGKISLREALANSLNIPALRTIQHVGVNNYLKVLHDLGFITLNKQHDFYDEGLALGNGEVTLYELVQAYSCLANRGIFHPLKFLLEDYQINRAKTIYSEEAASLIANILSDPYARRLEFGYNSVLNLPVQTAVKTGTSSDYRDAWVVGFNYRYVVGIWMGNLDRTPMDNVTGSTGPALALRSIFSKLNQYQQTSPLFLSPKLTAVDICIKSYETQHCNHRTEYFIATTQANFDHLINTKKHLKLLMPTDQLHIAFDPRIPSDHQKLSFRVSGLENGDSVSWELNKKIIKTSSNAIYKWPLTKGEYQLQVIIKHNTAEFEKLPLVHFVVK